MTTDRPDTLRDLVMSTARGLRGRWLDSLEPWQLTPHEYRALHVIGRGEPRLGDVAKSLRIAPRSATEVVDRLQDRGLVERVPDAADRRAICVRLTPSGLRTVADLRRTRDADADDYFAALDDHDRAELRRILERLRRP
ncbi:MarR family winged helix-turn-helix transcriptional regulator [Rhodococcus sp. NPDC058505]|uniref:MarR family winged helix-turn-helix transcriptional regulator n=1 Tax=unclassified Rhodococcus (in: high G+C Gram-positive bacteria) TaxID=192944 RepID=UPI0036474FF4